MGSHGCSCKLPCQYKDGSDAGLVLTRKDCIVTPTNITRRICGCKKTEQKSDTTEPVKNNNTKQTDTDYELFKTYERPPFPLFNENITGHSHCTPSSPRNINDWLNSQPRNHQLGILGITNKPTDAMDQPLRMPNLKLEESSYVSEINSIAPDARSMFQHGGTAHWGTAHGGTAHGGTAHGSPSTQQERYPGGAAKEVIGVPNQPRNTIEQLMDRLKRFECIPQSMQNMQNMPSLQNMPKFPNLSNWPAMSSFAQMQRGYAGPGPGPSTQFERYDGVIPYNIDAGLRAELRNYVATAAGEKKENRVWLVLVGLLHLLQAVLTTSAVLVYYLVWCYTQMMYFIMKSMLFFHNADGSMKFAIGLVTVTSVFFAYSLVVKVERIFFRF